MRDISNIEFRHLRQFVAVAEELHFRRAAMRLGMTQPPLSQSIAGLESALGVELLDRSRRQVCLTEAGRAFLGDARRMLSDLQQAAANARAAADGRVGVLRLTHVGTASYTLMPRLLACYREHFPQVTIDVTERTTSAQIEAILRGEADIGLIRMPVPETPGLRFEIIDNEPFVVALRSGHPLAQRETVGLSELAAESFVMFPAHEAPAFYARIVSACHDAGFVMKISQEATQLQTVISMVAAGFGIALVPASLRHLQQPGVIYRPCDPAPAALRTEIAMAWRRADPGSVVVSFLELARKMTSSRAIAAA